MPPEWATEEELQQVDQTTPANLLVVGTDARITTEVLDDVVLPSVPMDGEASPPPYDPDAYSESDDEQNNQVNVDMESDPHRVILNQPDANDHHKNNFISTTKYNPATFLPRVLYVQFRRFANFYFLMVVVVALASPASPVLKETAVLPLAFVLGVSIIKEAIEDNNRRQADKKANNTEYRRIDPEGNVRPVLSKDIMPGDLLIIEKGEFFPCDIVMLSSSEEEGMAYVETSNLDGETNLKPHRCLPQTVEWTDNKVLCTKAVVVDSEPPNVRLHQYLARIKIDEKTHSLSTKQLLLRGAQLRNTHWIKGVAVYTGVETKMFLNSQGAPIKQSSFERSLNNFVVAVFACVASGVLLLGSGAGIFQDTIAKNHWYLRTENQDPTEYALLHILTFFILTSFMIPISLYVTIELTRVGQGLLMWWDVDMFYEGRRMRVANTNLNEELGLVQYVFSDKTGTLTQNNMVFAKASVNGVIYNEIDNRGSLKVALNDPAALMHEYLYCLAICHTAVPEEADDGTIIYQAQSPDEEALLHCAAANGFKVISTKGGGVTLEVDGERQFFRTIQVLEFTSDRRRMSVIVECPDGSIKMYSKGADMIMKTLLAPEDQAKWGNVEGDIADFAREGLRTLVVAVAVLTPASLDEWHKKYKDAEASLVDREKRVAEAAALIENNLRLLGTSAIEDKLQDGVPDSIRFLLKAGVKVWVLTGDKQETAINIGHSSGLLEEGMHLAIVNAETSEECLARFKAEYDKIKQKRIDDFAMVIDGHTLAFALTDHVNTFAEFALQCHAVVCCRITPLQKALVVRMVREHKSALTLSIGDGANDVSMIQEAHVGVGIMGREGTQAERSSDFAIGQFRFLVKLMVVHGRWNYLRLVGLALYSFYKNMAFALPQIWFSFFNGFTGQSIYDSWVLVLFNITFAGLPPLVHGIFEKDIDSKTILKFPQVYSTVRTDHPFTGMSFLTWQLNGIYHSLVVFFGVYGAMRGNLSHEDGRETDLWVLSAVMTTTAITIVLARIALYTRYWTWITAFGIFGSHIFYLLFMITYSSLSETFQPSMHVTFLRAMETSSFWLLLVLLPVIALLPDFTRKAATRAYSPKSYHVLQEIDRLGLDKGGDGVELTSI